jgi:hypothetical protein
MIMRAAYLLTLMLLALEARASSTTAKQADTIQNSTGGFALSVPAGVSGASLVSTTCATSGNFLQWNGSAWVCGTAGSAGTPQADLFYCNGTTTAFTLNFAPLSTAAVIVSQNGIVQVPGASNDYTYTSTTLNLKTACATGQVLLVNYNR